MMEKFKEGWKALFILNCLPWLTFAEWFNISSNNFIVLAALPTTIISCIIFTIPIFIYQVWYEYQVNKKCRI